MCFVLSMFIAENVATDDKKDLSSLRKDVQRLFNEIYSEYHNVHCKFNGTLHLSDPGILEGYRTTEV